MSDRLEDFVRQNREAFDMHEPDPALWLKIQPEPRKQRNTGMRWLRIAAGLALIFAASSAGLYFLSGVNTTATEYASELEQEMAETEAWYQQVMYQRSQELEPFLTKDPVAREMLNSDLEELDQVYKELKEDLSEDVSNPEVIEAMILNYTIKLEILEDMLQQLKGKESNDENFETYAL